MAIGDLDDGTRFGLPPIGLPQAGLDTPGSDTQRRQLPGAPTRGSVFAWLSPTQPALLVDGPGAGANYTINLRLPCHRQSPFRREEERLRAPPDRTT
jgi:hypothetical protein